MRKYVLMFLTVVGTLLLTAPAFAQAPGGGSPTPEAEVTKWIWITSGFAMAIASAACGYAQSKATAAACEGLARNPGARAGIQFVLILALVLIESMALYTFAIVMYKNLTR